MYVSELSFIFLISHKTFYYCEDRISLLRDFFLKKICDKIISIM